MIKDRLITSGILIPLVIVSLFFLPQLVFLLITFMICILASWEWSQFIGFTTYPKCIWSEMFCSFLLSLILLSISVYYHLINFPAVFDFLLWLSLIWWLAALLLVAMYPCSAIVWHHSPLLRLLFGLLTIVPFFEGMLALRQFGYADNHLTGAWMLLYVMLLVWGLDSGSYIFGKLFGAHPLAPRISPGKTWEGLIGGCITSALVSWLFMRYVSLHIASITLIVSSVITVLAAVLGDLTESIFKREVGIKDSGYIIPGHGGILDRIDSLTAAVPVFSCLIFLVF
ncbi:phosphatidate cytidylyltransferase [Candidatus Gillettellia adelgis]